MHFDLKPHQKRVINIIESFFAESAASDAKTAFDKIAPCPDENGNQTNHYARRYQVPETFGEELKDRPYVCLRVPTAGGKTYMAACTLPVLEKYRAEQLAREGETPMRAPVILWLTPSDTICKQTITMLKNPDHPCGQAVRNAFGHKIRICDIDDFDILPPQDFADNGVLIVSTAQMFRIRKTSKPDDDGMNIATRRVYAHKEDFDAHFEHFLPPNPPPGLEYREDGKPKHSFVNLLHLARPAVVCDEAHNFVSDLSHQVLRRINPACVLEWTATPRGDKDGTFKNNVLASVGADELKNSEMIKMPVQVGEHQEGWESAVQAAKDERDKLAKIAVESGDSVRPIVLYKATNKNGEVPPQKLKEHLINACGIAEDEIAVHTGEVRDLENMDLLLPSCKINHVITVDALREGWDCAFVYVLCSVANVKSEGAAEQLLGRVMRMPFAQRRNAPELNAAYAHMPVEHASAAVEVLRKNLALEQGYEEAETREIVKSMFHQSSLPLDDIVVQTEHPPDFSGLPEELKRIVDEKIVVSKKADGYEVKISGDASKEIIDRITAAVPRQRRQHESDRMENHFMQRRAAASPAARGEKFAQLPFLFFYSPEAKEEIVANEDSLYEVAEWNNIGDDCVLPELNVVSTSEVYEIATGGGKVRYSKIGEYESPLLPAKDDGKQRAYLTKWLEREIRKFDGRYFPETLNKIVDANIAALLEKDAPLSLLIRCKYQIARELRLWLDNHEQKISDKNAEQFLFANDSLKCIPKFSFPKRYIPTTRYNGAYLFNKHFYGEIDKFDSGEEYECAKAIDGAPEVKHWIRNIPKRDESYVLPLGGTRNFYPDFVVELKNGAVVIIEYKGAYLLISEETKRRIGEKVEEISQRTDKRFFFAMISGGKGKTKDVYAKIHRAVREKIAAVNAVSA